MAGIFNKKNKNSSTVDVAELCSIGEAFYDTDNFEKAYEYLIQSAEAGYPRAINMIGLMYRHGEYLNKDEETSFLWFQKAAELGYRPAFYNMALYYKNVKQDYVNTAICYEKGATLGHAGSQNGIGLAYENGRGVPKDLQKAVYWYQKAADQDYSYGCYNLAYSYHHGRGVDPNPVKALYYYEKAAEKGHTASQYATGKAYKWGSKWGAGITIDLEKAIYWLNKAAEKNDEDAFYELGHCYRYGIGVEQNRTTSFSYFLKSAEAGHTDAQAHIGICYEKGDGVTADIDTAKHWYTLAAEKEDLTACANLARIYRYNYSDYESAIYWYEKAAELEYDNAYSQLAYLYHKGEGVAKDLEKARSYYEGFVSCCTKNPSFSKEKAEEYIATAKARIQSITEELNQKKLQAAKPAYKKLPLAVDLMYVAFRNNKLMNDMTLDTRSSITNWANALGKPHIYDYIDEFHTFDDEVLAYIGRDAMLNLNVKIAVCAYCSYLDRYPEIKYSLPAGTREKCKSQGLDFEFEEQLVDKAKELQMLVENHLGPKKNPNYKPMVNNTNSTTSSSDKTKASGGYPTVDANACIKCEMCKYICPVSAITIVGSLPTFNKIVCLRCGICADECARRAISL